MKVTLSNGMTVEGTADQIENLLTKLDSKPDPKLYYISSSHGPILISEMDTNHLRNAVLKILKDWLSVLYTYSDPHELVTEIISGYNDETFLYMLKELNTREEFE